MDAADAMILEFLDDQRRAVLAIVDGMDADLLRQSALPSDWTCVGMVQHMTINERYWLRWAAGGEQITMHYDDMVENDFVVASETSAETVIGRYRAEAAAANTAISSVSFDDPPRNVDPQWETWFPPGAIENVRCIVLHMIEETARHAGHLDATRELLDARQV